MTLYDDVTNSLSNPRVSALIVEEVLEPSKGRQAAVAPPTYAGAEPKVAEFALSDGVSIPVPDEQGWHLESAQAGDQPRLGKSVIINSLAACADGAETGLYRNQHRLGITLPAIVLDSRDLDEEQLAGAITRLKKAIHPHVHQQAVEALRLRTSSWELAHRMADAWLMFSAVPGNTQEQIWGSDNEIRTLIQHMGHEHGDTVFAHAPNVAMFGNWLSSGTAQRHAVPRAYSSEVTGYGVQPISMGATKMDATGGATNTGRKVTASAAGISVDQKGKRPSELGFGQVPSRPKTRAFVCEVILRQTSLALRALDRFTYSDDDSRSKAFAAKRVYTLLAMAGHLLSQEDGFLRSECDLVVVHERWGWRLHGVRKPEAFAAPTLEEVTSALQEALAAAQTLGLHFAEPINVTLSDPQMDLILDRVLKASEFEAVDA